MYACRSGRLRRKQAAVSTADRTGDDRGVYRTAHCHTADHRTADHGTACNRIQIETRPHSA